MNEGLYMRAILTYEDTGNKRVCGQTIGADSSGEFCIIYNGDEEKIHKAAKEILDNLHNQRRLGKWLLIYDQASYSGNTVIDIDV